MSKRMEGKKVRRVRSAHPEPAGSVERHGRLVAALNADPDPKRLADLWVRRAKIILAAVRAPIPETMTPAVRARWLADTFHHTAKILEDCSSGPAGLAVMTDVAERLGVTQAWRALHDLTDVRHQRVHLITLIEFGAHVTMGFGAQRQRLARRGIRIEPTVSVSQPPTVPAITERVRHLYSVSFPEVATRLDMDLLAAAIRAWNNPGGRPKKGTSTSPKWTALSILMRQAGMPGCAERNIKREWLREQREARRRLGEAKAQMSK